MSRRWAAWSLASLLVAAMAAGALIEARLDVAADPVDERSHTHADLPHFECDDRSTVPYQFPEERRQKNIDWLEQNLDLSTSQVDEMVTVFNDASFRADEFWRQTRDNYCDLRDRLHSDVRAVLDEEQTRELEVRIRSHDHKTSDPNAADTDDGKRP